MRTQVAIIGAGPAGLTLAHLLHRSKIESVVIENRSREYVIERVRAGVLEQATVDLMVAAGVGDRLQREGMRHGGVHIAFNGTRHRIDFAELTDGRAITIYGQNELVKDLIDARLQTGAPLFFESEDVALANLRDGRPIVRFVHREQEYQVEADFVAGCDGFHGISRPAIPPADLRIYERAYPFAWLGILAEAAPSSHELVYSLHERGFALFSMRSPQLTRLYLQCGPDEDAGDWSDDRIWSELHARLGTDDGWRPTEGRIVQKAVTGMRSMVAEPMRWQRMFLAGDAAHIVPPTGAKGLNLAIADVARLAVAIETFYRDGGIRLLDEYSASALARVWRAQRFSWWMTATLHRAPDRSDFDYRRQLADLEYLVSSRAAMTSFAESYVGAPFDFPQREPRADSSTLYLPGR
jgi:p-hydroxybenzoate 3-monooxygenase